MMMPHYGGPPSGGAGSGVYTTATAVWSLSRNLFPGFSSARYTTATGVDSLKDQTGNARNLNQATGTKQPVVTTAGPNSITCADFDGSDDLLSTGATGLSNFIANNSGWIIVSCIIDAITTNNGTGASTFTNNHIWGDNLGYVGLCLRTTGPNVTAYNYDGNYDTQSSVIATATPYVFSWRHEGGNVYLRVNDGTESAGAASGNTQVVTNSLIMGHNGTAGGNVKIFEMATWSTIPSSTDRDAIVADWKTWIGA